jgi:hypothetical protein
MLDAPTQIFFKMPFEINKRMEAKNAKDKDKPWRGQEI